MFPSSLKMNPSSAEGRERRDAQTALGLIAAWMGVLILVTRDVVRHYFPLADEWALIADSHPDFAHPSSWLTEGFRDYFQPPAGLPHEPGNNLIRPIFNLTYWLCGHVLPPESGGYLYVSYFAIAACSGLAYLAIARLGISRRIGLVLASAVPMMPSLVPALEPLIYPCMGFDAVAACFCMLAYLAYRKGHLARAGAWLALAVFTKETALPIAVALPTMFLIEQRLRILRDPRSMAGLALVAAPVLAWLFARLHAFGFADLTTVYVLQATGHDWLYRLLRILSKWPFWVDASQLVRQPGLTLDNVAAGLLLAVNGVVMTTSLGMIVSRLLKRQTPRLEEVCLLSCYLFLLVVGVSPRYGVLLDVFLLICLASWLQESSQRLRGDRLVAAALSAGLAVCMVQTLSRYPELERNFIRYSEVGHRYVAALRTFGPGETVGVLNDPVTFWTPVKWLSQAMGVQANVVKLADYAWSRQRLDGINTLCYVSLQAVSPEPLEYRFTQSCGIDVLSSTRWLRADQPVHLAFEDGIAIDLVPFASISQPPADHVRWQSMRISLDRADIRLLYFDPRTREFKRVPAVAESTLQSRSLSN